MVASALSWLVELAVLHWVVLKVEVTLPRDAGLAVAIVNLGLSASALKAIKMLVFSTLVNLPGGITDQAVGCHCCPLLVIFFGVCAVKARALEPHILECEDSLHVLHAVEALGNLDFVHAVIDSDLLATVTLKQIVRQRCSPSQRVEAGHRLGESVATLLCSNQHSS